MPRATDLVFRSTLEGLDAGLRVVHIAETDLRTCDVSDDAERVLADPDSHRFDQIPVRDDGQVVGVLERVSEYRAAGTVAQAMRPLGDSMLVSGDEPLRSYVRGAAARPYRLVVIGSSIGGIVAPSDLLKLPVRVLAFGLITHLEALMAQQIGTHCPVEDQWLRVLSETRRKKVLCKQEDLADRNEEPPLLELTDFCDKRELILKLGLRLEKKRFNRELKKLEELRNKLSHAGEYISGDRDVAWFTKQLQNAEHWIDEITSQ